jgi:hypothetical protein
VSRLAVEETLRREVSETWNWIEGVRFSVPGRSTIGLFPEFSIQSRA